MSTPETMPVTRQVAASGSLLFSIWSSQFGISLVYGAVPGVLLALQIEDLAGDDKVAVLSIFTFLGAIAALLAQPLAGMLSDRTRTRWGSRTPYVLGGTIVVAPILFSMGFIESLAVLGVLYVASEFVLSASQGPLAAILPDRVPENRRGRFSAGLGLGIMLGSVGGTILGSVLADDLVVAYMVLSVLPLAFTATRLFIARDSDNRESAPTPASDSARWWRTFFVNPRTHPDFWWAVGSRTLVYTGFFIIQGYALYILSDYIGAGDAAVDYVGIAAAIAAVCISLTAVPAGLLSDRLGRRKVFVTVASIVMALGLLIPLAAPTVEGYLTMMVVVALAFGTFEAVDTALVTQVLPRSNSFAQDLGVTNVAAIAPQILAPALAGVIVIVTGSFAPLFPVAAVIVVVGGLVVFRVRGVR
ncbi:MFS transporter [Agromyces sp. SYSU T0242]|uniref:MFS transporter n=1 Tax=Agromyces litoreus TaxID=3158561 RepID=UPI0033985553